VTPGFWFKKDYINRMYTEEEKLRQTDATVIKSTKYSEGKGRIEVKNVK